jgi:hypothetical protein
MSFTDKKQRRFEAGRTRFALPALAASPVVRYLVYALLAVAAAIYGILSHFSGAPPPPMHRPATPPPAPTFDADAGEIPVPETFDVDGGAP